MDNFRLFSKSQLDYMNYDKKYGCNWIKYDDNIKTNYKTEFKLFATGDYTMSSGRIYIALPADKTLSAADKIKYNIIE